MLVMLKLLFGANAGKLLKVTGPEFVIGRDEGCDLRLQTETVSRRHCVINVKGSQVTVEDLGSLNGVFVNRQRISGQSRLESGDRLQIGKLLFELVLEPVAAKEKGAKPDSGLLDTDISDWLAEAEEAEEARRRQADQETREYDAELQQLQRKKTPRGRKRD